MRVELYSFLWCFLKCFTVLPGSLPLIFSDNIQGRRPGSSEFISEGRFPPRQEENDSSRSLGGRSLWLKGCLYLDMWKLLCVCVCVKVYVQRVQVHAAVLYSVCVEVDLVCTALVSNSLTSDKGKGKRQSTSQSITVPTFVMPLNTPSVRPRQIYWISISASFHLHKLPSPETLQIRGWKGNPCTLQTILISADATSIRFNTDSSNTLRGKRKCSWQQEISSIFFLPFLLRSQHHL